VKYKSIIFQIEMDCFSGVRLQNTGQEIILKTFILSNHICQQQKN